MENCAVCKKYLPTQGLQEQGMCNECDDRTHDVSISFEDEFKECSDCDGHPACEDFGCAFENGCGHLVNPKFKL